ncbi:ABC transporter substrate-binding protein [Streptomyces hirsutus]|uniref:ABC transporter substrate-binding protein n=1 Tax=Streptomyces hirsutus TaxID=35620 RepID=UPI00365B62DE
MRRDKNAIRAAGAAAALCLMLTACSGSADATGATGAGEPVVRQGVYTSHLPLDLPVIIAKDQGLFKKHGVSVELTDIQTGTDMVTAIISKSIDVGNPATPPGLVVFTQQGADLGALAGGTKLDFRVLVPTKTSVPGSGASMADRLATLKGKTVMVIGTGTLTDWWFRDAVKSAGLGPKDINIIAATNVSGQIAAFKAGKADAVVAFGTLPGLIGEEGKDYEVLMGIPEGHTGSRYDSYLQTFVAATHAWQKKNGKTVDKYCAALAEATSWLSEKSNHAAAVDAMAQWTKLPKDKAEDLLETTVYKMKLDPENWREQGDTIGESKAMDFTRDVNDGCSSQFAQ